MVKIRIAALHCYFRYGTGGFRQKGLDAVHTKGDHIVHRTVTGLCLKYMSDIMFI